MPAHGIFVENRLRAFLKTSDAEIKVIAPVPWFPFQNDTFGPYAAWAQAPERETRHDIEVFHPRYFIPPKFSMRYAPFALARSLRTSIHEIAVNGWDCDLIDAHYFYPDGVAAAQVAKEFNKPLVITARGSDINLIPKHAGPRRAIVVAAAKADAVIAVAGTLKDKLGAMGVQRGKISVLRNGVDLELFTPGDRNKARAELGLSGKTILSVGHLIDRKGHDLVIDAMRSIPDITLLIAGEGEKRSALEAQAKRVGLLERVRFLGPVAHENLNKIYRSADMLVLASSREGWPNVLLEAMACGTPCIATNIPGSNEVIGDPAAGELVEHRSSGAIAEAIKTMIANPPDRAETRRYAEGFSWEETIHQMATIFSELTEKSRLAASVKTTPIKFGGNNSNPRLIITVDTEEQFDWSNSENADHRVNDPADIDRFQALCAEMDAAPLYFLTYPLLKDPKCIAYFRALLEQRAANCGLHLHQWVTPPTHNFSAPYFSFQKNLPLDAHLKKLTVLADAFEAAFGERAQSHRAGRYGIAPENYAQLAALSIQYDFSPSPAFDYLAAGGPDFSGFSNKPFSAFNGDHRICVTPVSGAVAIRGTNLFLSQEANQPGFAPRREPLHSRLTTPMRLSPEGARLADLKALTQRLISDGAPILSFTLHSTSLTPGANPYVKGAADVEQILDLTRNYLSWFTQTTGGEIISLADLAQLYESSTPQRSA